MDNIINKEEIRVIEVLHDLVSALPVGVASAYHALHDRLEMVTLRLCDENNPTYMDMLIDTRKTISEKLNPDYKKGLLDYRLDQESEYLRQRGEVAYRLLSGIEPSLLNDENKVLNEELKWIIPSLDECPEDVNDPRRISRFIPEIKAAHEIKNSLNGTNSETELRYLQVQALLISRLAGHVPASIIYVYWQQLEPKSTENMAYYNEIMDNIIALPCEEWSHDEYARGVLEFLQALSENALSSAIDVNVRIMSAPTTSFIIDSCRTISRELHGMENRARYEGLINLADKVVTDLRDYKPKSCKHYDIPASELCAYSEDFKTNKRKPLFPMFAAAVAAIATS